MKNNIWIKPRKSQAIISKREQQLKESAALHGTFENPAVLHAIKVAPSFSDLRFLAKLNAISAEQSVAMNAVMRDVKKCFSVKELESKPQSTCVGKNKAPKQ